MEEIVCSKCGEESGINQLYCQGCGAKLDYSGFKPNTPTKGGKVRTGRGGEGKKESSFSILSLVRMIIFILLLGALGLLVWPVPPTGQKGNHDNALECNRKLVRLDHAAKDMRQEAATFSESEVNGFLADIVKESFEGDDGSGGTSLNLTEINVRFTPKYVVTVITAKVGPLKLSYEVMLEVKPGQKLAAADITQARFGHLKLPGGAKDWMASRVLKVFKDRTREQYVLDNSAVTGLSDRKATLTVRTR